MAASQGSSLSSLRMSSNSPTEAASTAMFTLGGWPKQEPPGTHETPQTVRLSLTGWTTNPLGQGAAHMPQGGLQTSGYNTTNAQLVDLSISAHQQMPQGGADHQLGPRPVSTRGDRFLTYQQRFKRPRFGAGPSGACHQPSPGQESAARSGKEDAGPPQAPQLPKLVPRPVLLSPRHCSRASCDTPSTGAIGAWEDKMGRGRRASEKDETGKILAPHVNMDAVLDNPGPPEDSNEGPTTDV